MKVSLSYNPYPDPPVVEPICLKHPASAEVLVAMCLTSLNTSGGQLVIQHHHEEKTIDLTASADSRNPFSAHWTAFYADCVHHVLPLKSGCRLALVYNLVYTGEQKPELSVDPSPAVNELLQRWTDEGSEPAALRLAHAYSSISLQDQDSWKGQDRHLMQTVTKWVSGGQFWAYVGQEFISDQHHKYSDIVNWTVRGAVIGNEVADVTISRVLKDSDVRQQLELVKHVQYYTGNDSKQRLVCT
jgi:hypothetical protein